MDSYGNIFAAKLFARAADEGRSLRAGLDGLNLEIAPGERVGLVGRPGVGKTAVVNPLPRFPEPWSDCILVDGQDVAG